MKFDAGEIYLSLMNTMLVKYACWKLLFFDYQYKQTPRIISACSSPCQLVRLCALNVARDLTCLLPDAFNRQEQIDAP